MFHGATFESDMMTLVDPWNVSSARGQDVTVIFIIFFMRTKKNFWVQKLSLETVVDLTRDMEKETQRENDQNKKIKEIKSTLHSFGWVSTWK